MKFDVRQYVKLFDENHIHVIYNGPIWSNCIDGLAEMMLKRLEFDDSSNNSSHAVFSIFVEQMNNMMMYSAEKEEKNDPDGNPSQVSKGVFILGVQNDEYFIQTGNAVTNSSAEVLKSRLDHLNTLNKTELRQYYKERMKAANDNPESKGAGLGLIEIARRASSPIEYEFEPYDDEKQYFTMFIRIKQGGKK